LNRKARENLGPVGGYEKCYNLLEFLDKRVTPFHKKESKPQPIARRKLSRNARRLIRRILAQTRDENPVWCEGNEDVAKALNIDRSTVVRIVKRLRQSSFLQPVDTTGGRGRPSQYLVDRGKAQALVHDGYWGATAQAEDPKLVHKEEQEQVHEQKPAQGFRVLSSKSTAKESGQQGYAEDTPQLLDAAVFPGLVSDELWDWLSEKAKSAAKLLTETLRNPSARGLIGYGALVVGISAIGIRAIYKAWTNKDKRLALILALPTALVAYNGCKLVRMDLERLKVEQSMKQRLTSARETSVQIQTEPCSERIDEVRT